MIVRRVLVTVAGLSVLLGLAISARAQAPEKVVAMLGGTEQAVQFFTEGLARHGWIVGENVRLEHRDASDRDEAERVAAELIALAPDVAYGMTTFRALALANATSTIPVVFSNVTDPIGAGLVRDIAHPGSNVTGFMFVQELDLGRFLQVFLQAAPAVTTVGYFVDEGTRSATFIAALERAASELEVSLQVIRVSSIEEYAPAIVEFASNTPRGGLVVDPSIVFWLNRDAVVEAVDEAGIPAIYFWRPFVEAGGLMSYGVDEWEPIRRAGEYAGRILNGADPGDLPVQASTNFYLALNIEAASAIGIAFPTELLALADQVFE